MNDDLISRDAAIDACNQSINMFEATDRIKDLPPVTPKQRTGHWIDIGWKCQTDTDEILYGYGCSECGAISFFRKSDNKILGGKWCHYCGAKMEGQA